MLQVYFRFYCGGRRQAGKSYWITQADL